MIQSQQRHRIAQNSTNLILGLFVMAAAFPGTLRADVSIHNTPPDGPGNPHYLSNRAPLLPSRLIKLPLGTVEPTAWLREQLNRMANGFSGRLPELSAFCDIEGNAWVSPEGEGEHGWEEVPYWLRGFISLAHLTGDRRLHKETDQWIEGLLANQRTDGYFGPQLNAAAPDLWPNMPALYVLRSHHEATGDERVPTLMERYFRWQSRLAPERVFPDSWQKWRGGDNLDSILWLYNLTGEPWLLDLARVNHERTADWTGGIPTWHGVNICQGFREPAQFYQLSKDEQHLAATERNYRTVMDMYGQVPGGMFGADENTRKGYTDPRQAAESCSMAEFMHSDEMLLRITGNPVWADRCEEIAFNSLPVSMSADLQTLHYLTAPNQVQLDRANKSPMIENAGDMFSYNPYDYRCCQHNMAFAWPYFTEHLWMATQDRGVALAFYAPSRVTATVADGQKVEFELDTRYPFDGTATIQARLVQPAEFPLWIRIPAWCAKPEVRVVGEEAALPNAAGKWVRIARTWRNGDKVDLRFPMPLRVVVWTAQQGAVSIHRGPLAFSLRIGENMQPYVPVRPREVEARGPAWTAYEVYPRTPWNYGLVVDPASPGRTIEIATVAETIPAQPFASSAAPVVLRAKAKRIPQWKQEDNGMVSLLPASPVDTSETSETIELIPMGCARLRISVFPRAN